MKHRKKMRKRVLAAALSVTLAVTGILPISPQKSAADSSDIVKSSCVQTNGGLISDNLEEHEYNFYHAEVVKSYVAENVDGTFERVESGQDGVYVETYDASMQMTASRKIEKALPIFGGYFRGEKYNFLVFGQENPSESDDVEIMRVVKYDMSWNYVGQQSVKGANTTIPFRSGSLRMSEENGILYVHTCHQMYESSDGLHHQANMTYAFDEETMETKKQQYIVWNYSTGYVSHSFNQFIVAEGDKIYRLDHGDAYPRCIFLSKNNNYLTDSNVAAGTSVLDIVGEIGQNATGVCVGGFGKQNEWLITVGNSVEQNADNYDVGGPRNVFVTLTKDVDGEDFAGSFTVWLTQYNSGDDVNMGNPYLVMDKDGYYVLWEETRMEQKKSTTVTKIVKMNTAGKSTEGPYTLQARLSGCQPIITSDDRMVWYVTNETAPLFYSLDLKNLSAYDNVEIRQDEMSSPSTSPEPAIPENVYMAQGAWTGWGGEDSYPSAQGKTPGYGLNNYYYKDKTNMAVSEGYNCGLELMNPYNAAFTGADNEMAVFIKKMKSPVIRVTTKNGSAASGWNWNTELSLPSGQEVSLTSGYLSSGYFALFGNDDTITKVEIYDKNQENGNDNIATSEPQQPSQETPVTSEPQKPDGNAPVTKAPASGNTDQPVTASPAMDKPSASPVVKRTATPSAISYRPSYTKNAPSKPGKVNLKKVKALRRGRVKVTWNNVYGANEYQVQYSVRRSFAGKRTNTAYGKSTYLYLKKKKTYYVRVRAVKYGNSANNYRDVRGAWSIVKKVKTKR